jgi:hypothetical protein
MNRRQRMENRRQRTAKRRQKTDEQEAKDGRTGGKGRMNRRQRTDLNRRQRTDIREYSLVNRIIQLWNWLPAEILGTLPCKLNAFRKRVRKVINVVN